MNTKNWPAKLLLSVGVLACASAMCGGLGAGVTAPLANVARDYSPENRVKALATTTAIAPALAPTRTYLERVLPTQQAVEAQEIVETTQRRYANARTASNMWLWLRAGLAGVAMCGVLAFVASASIVRVKTAIEHEPYQVLPDKPIYFPREKRVTHALTAATWTITTDHPADVQHGTLLIESRAGPRYRVTGRDQRLPVVIEGLRNAD